MAVGRFRLARPQEMKNAAEHSLAAFQVSARFSEAASLAVIGTLRPTEQRRASLRLARIVPSFRHMFSRAGEPARIGLDGADRDRTGDLCSAIAALSQLSY